MNRDEIRGQTVYLMYFTLACCREVIYRDKMGSTTDRRSVRCRSDPVIEAVWIKRYASSENAAQIGTAV